MNTTQAALGSIFSSFGMIESIRVLTHKNCGFINFYTQEDAIKAKRALQNREIMGPGTGTVRIGFAKVPAVKSTQQTQQQQQQQQTTGGLVMSDAGFQYPSEVVPSVEDWPSKIFQNEDLQQQQQQQQMMLYMMEMMGNNNVVSAMVAERKLIMQDFGEEDSDGPTFDGNIYIYIYTNLYLKKNASPYYIYT
jgi:RNA recognition motif-containing protein